MQVVTHPRKLPGGFGTGRLEALARRRVRSPDWQTLAEVGTVQGLTHGGNIRVILGFDWDNGKENGNYYLGFRKVFL